MAGTEQTWASMKDALCGFFRRRIPDDSLVEDLLQETFVRVHQRLPEVRDPGRLGAWVFRVARSVLADHFRGTREESGAAMDRAACDDTREENLNREVEEWLHEFLDALPAEYRKAVELAELEGLSQGEVAGRLGLSLSGAKSRVQRGRARLRALLLACCHLDFDHRGNVVDYERRGDCRRCEGC